MTLPLRIDILGAGLAGLLAGNILRRHTINIIEKAPAVPDNHTAVLRFRDNNISNVTGIPFRRVRVDKGYWDGDMVLPQAPLDAQNRYSLHVTGKLAHRSISSLSPEDRYVAPLNLARLMADGLPISFGVPVDSPRRGCPVISTLPMPVLMKMTGWEPRTKFNYQEVITVRARISSPEIAAHVVQTLYHAPAYERSRRFTHWYRATLNGSQMILEFTRDGWASLAEDAFGSPSLLPEADIPLDPKVGLHAIQSTIPIFFGGDYPLAGIDGLSCNSIRYGKLTPIDEEERRAFLIFATEKFGVYSLGRFATWRNLLLGDLVKDVRIIEELIRHNPLSTKYSRSLLAHSPKP